jgi:hypothetical protein
MIPRIARVDRNLSIWYGFRGKLAACVPIPKFVGPLGMLRTNFGIVRTQASYESGVVLVLKFANEGLLRTKRRTSEQPHFVRPSQE